MMIVRPLQEKDDGTYILLPDGVFENEGDVYLSLAAIDENKIVITSNQLTLQVDGSNRIVSKVSPSEKYWEIEVLNAMKVWYANVVDPTFNSSNEKLNQLIRRTEEHEEKAEDLQKKAEEQAALYEKNTGLRLEQQETLQQRAAELEQQAETLQSRLNETAAEKQETAEKAAKAEETAAEWKETANKLENEQLRILAKKEKLDEEKQRITAQMWEEYEMTLRMAQEYTAGLPQEQEQLSVK